MKTLRTLLIIPFMLLASCTTVSFKPNNQFLQSPKKIVKTTAYTHTEGDHVKYRNKSAVGTPLKSNHSIASDWSQFPLGTILEIDNHRYVVDDYGSALVKKEGEIPVIDIYQPTKRAMKKYGSHYTDNIRVVQLGDYQRSLDILMKRQKYAHCRTMADRIKRYSKLYASYSYE